MTNDQIQKSTLLTVGLALCVLAGCSSNSPTESILETPSFPEAYYLETGMDTYQRGLFTRSRDYWQQLINGYPSSAYVPLAELKIADSFFFSEQYAEAIEAYKNFLAANPANEGRDYAELQLANSHYYLYKGPGLDPAPLKSAIKLYDEFLGSHPDGVYTPVAIKKRSTARTLLAKHEKSVAAFYKKQGMKSAR
ncbi:MAG: outer membrane protein assembly factor BamD [bacterium]|nr:outer membrane protein assembly factor BamD [bacterium]